MRNILRMNIFRMKRTKMGYILGGVSVLLTLFIFALNWLLDYGMNTLFYGEGLIPQVTNIFDSAITQSTSSVGPLLVLMFAMLFLNTVISSGYEKNLIGYQGNKFALSGANIVTVIIYGIILMTVTTSVSILISGLCYKNAVFEGFGKFMAYFTVSFVEMIAYCMLIIALCDLGGRYILGMILGVLYIFYCSLIYQVIDLAVDVFLHKTITIENYTLLGAMKSFRLSNSYTDYLISGLIASLVFVLGYFLDVYALKKRELK